MAFVVVGVNPDGTAVLTSTVPNDLETSAAYARRHGGEVVSEATVTALRVGDKPGGGVPGPEFRARLFDLGYALADKPAALRERWDRVLKLLEALPVVYPDRPPVKKMITRAVADGLLTADEAKALAGA